MNIKISDKLALPIDVVTTATAVLGIRGSGKTNTGVIVVEDLLEAGHQVVVIDPLDVWWGLKGTADDKSAGYSITVIGGPHADVPLAEGDGNVLADFLADNPVPAVLSLRHLTKSASRRFMTDFAEQIYHRKGEAGKNTPVLMVVDEASLFVPQHVMGEMARLVGAIQSWVRQGRVAGIGCMLIDQRPATVNKDVLSQIELLVCHRLVAPQDRKALREWIEAHSTAEQREVFEKSVATLAKGEAWFWSPEWLDLFQRVQVRKRRTFDSSATPKAGQRVAVPKRLAAVELDTLRSKLAQTIQKAKADDPKELRRQIAELQKQLAVKPAMAAPERIEVPVLSGAAMAVLKSTGEQTAALAAAVSEIIVKAVAPQRQITPARQPAPMPQRAIQRPAVASPPRRAASGSGESLPKGERAVLIAVAQHADGCSREQLTVLTGYKRSSRDAYIQRLRERGHIEQQGDQITASQSGIDALGNDYEPLPVGDALREHWLTKLPEGERRVLEVLVADYPNVVDRTSIDDQTGYKRSSRDTYLQRLSSRRLVESGRDGVRASEILFG